MQKYVMKHFYALLLVLSLNSLSFSATIPTIFGDIESNDSIITDLIASRTMERMKDIDQGGPCVHFGHAPAFSRFDHCVGVWALLKRFGASLQEQVAGLSHDASHTSFSHVADTFFNGGETEEHSYQDAIHLTYLASQEDVMAIFAQYNFPLADANPDHHGYRRLEQLLPDMCGDRLEYNLHTAIVYGKLSIAEANEILKYVKFEEGYWYFTDINAALRFANLPLDFTQTVWGVPWNMVLYDYFVKVLKRAIDIDLITLDDFRKGLDSEIMAKLRQSEDAHIKDALTLCENVKSSFDIIEGGAPFDKQYHPKFRGIDPWVMIDDELVRLSSEATSFKEEYCKVRTWCMQGFKVKFKPAA